MASWPAGPQGRGKAEGATVQDPGQHNPEAAAACLDAFVAGDLPRAARLVAAVPAPHDPAIRTIALFFRARRLAAAGDRDGADAAHAELAATGVPFPAVLAACAAHAQDRGRPAEALAAAFALDLSDPGALRRHARGLVEPGSPPDLLAALHDTLARPYAALAPKRALVARFGLAAAMRLHARMLSPGTALQPRPVRLAFLADHAAQHGRDHAQTHALRPVPIAASPVMGGGGPPASTRPCRATFTATLPDALVAGRSNYILHGDAAVLDCHPHELALCPIDYDLDPMIFRDDPPGPEDRPALVALAPRRPADLLRVRCAVSLLGIHSHAFGHMITEFLPRLWHVMDRPDAARITVLVDRGMPAQHLQAIRMFLAPAQPMLQVDPGQMVAVDALLVSPMPVYMPAGPKPGLDDEPPVQVVDVAAYGPLLRKAAARLGPLPPGPWPERLFLSRKPHQHRRMINQDEVIAILARRGYVAVDFADHGFAEQMAMIRAARIVLGADGSAMGTTLLAPPGTRVGRLMHGFPDDPDWYADLGHALGHRVRVLTGETVRKDPQYRIFSDYRIPPDRLEALADALEAD